MTRPTPCQQCKADLAAARACIAEWEGEAVLRAATLGLLEARVAELDAKCLANAQSYDDLCEELEAARFAKRTWRQSAEHAQARVKELEAALSSAVDRLNGFLSAYEGDPDPSENDTKQLVARLIGTLQTSQVT